MSELRILVQNIGAMFLVICAGWLLRRRGFLGAETSAMISKLVVDVTLPSMVVVKMLQTMSRQALRQEWPCIVLGAAEIILPWLFAVPLARWFAPPRQRATFQFLVSMPNWIYLPLPIVLGLYGDDGLRILLLYNVGVQLTMWSFGVWILRGRNAAREALTGLLRSVGLWATILGIAAALMLPLAPPLTGKAGAGWMQLPCAMLLQSLDLVGSLTIPLSLLTIGLQQGGSRAGQQRLSRTVWGVVIGRLLVTPVLTAAVVLLILQWTTVPETVRRIGCLVSFMPVALSCSVMAERYGGDAELSAQSIFWTTLLSIVTVPILFGGLRWQGF